MGKKLKVYSDILSQCLQIFLAKNKDYGTSWRILRLPSITDQIMIKAQRIRTIQEKKTQKVDDKANDEFMGIINYCIIALIQIEMQSKNMINLDIDTETCSKFYTEEAKKLENLFKNKNHDYDSVWQQMRVESMTDIILMKILRIKKIENNRGKTLCSEGIESNYRDIINYAIFCLILDKIASEKQVIENTIST